MKRHDNIMNIEEMSKDTGYSVEEISVMLNYFIEHVNQLDELEEQQRENCEFLDDLLDML